MKQVAAAVILSDGQVLIARRKAGEKMAGYWEFPGGKVENGETPQACLERELKEELGLTAAAGPVLTSVNYQYDHGAIELLAMPAEILSGDLILTVHDQVCRVKPEDLGRYALAPADILICEQLEAFFKTRKDAGTFDAPASLTRNVPCLSGYHRLYWRHRS